MFSFAPSGSSSAPTTLERMVRPSSDAACIDLTKASWISPYLLCLIPVLVSNALPGHLRFLTPSDSAARYASRMHLGNVLDDFGIDHELPPVRAADQSKRLVELTPFSAEDLEAPERLTRLTQTRCDSNGVPAEVADEIAGHVYELCNNAVSHARCDQAWLCAQSYQQSRLEFVVADAGRGIRASLEGTAYECDSHAESITTAAQRRTSSIGRPQHFGIGLSTVVDYAGNMNGSTHIRSGDAVVRFGSSPFSAPTMELSGTIVGCSIQF